MNKKMKLKIFSALVITGAMFVSCKEAPKTTGRPMANHETMKVTTANRSVLEEYSAKIHSDDYVEIRPQVSGVITKILVDDGDKVKKGQVLFVIDQVPYQAALQTAEANLKSAEARVATAELKLKSSEELFAANVVSDFDLQTSKNSLTEANAALALAKASHLKASNDLSYTEVKSPYDGVAGVVPYNVGALVSASIAEPLVTVASPNKMFARFAMSEADMLELTSGNRTVEEAIKNLPPVTLILSHGGEYEIKGKVDAISGVVDRETGSVMFRAAFENPNGVLRDGGVGRAVITKEIDNVIVIPKEATFELQNKVLAYKVVNGKATSTILTVESLNGREYAVTSGLKVGDEIIAKGVGLVREGTPVGKKNTIATQKPVKK